MLEDAGLMRAASDAVAAPGGAERLIALLDERLSPRKRDLRGAA
jgi:hypothetical protein